MDVVEREVNRELINKYPWLSLEREWFWEDGGYYKNLEEDYKYTWLDYIPDGWRLAFADELCERIQKDLEEHNFENQFAIIDIKEKWGQLDISTSPIKRESKLYEILSEYRDKSMDICINCGKPVEWVTKGWTTYICDDCYKECINNGAREEQFEHIHK